MYLKHFTVLIMKSPIINRDLYKNINISKQQQDMNIEFIKKNVRINIIYNFNNYKPVVGPNVNQVHLHL